ncbi:MAG: hypothetical protein PSN34_05445 [Urechidicola sp.]|nr:hypothetical protein [Urechidicola sp.]
MPTSQPHKSELKKKLQNSRAERTIVCLIPIIVENPTLLQPLFQLLSERFTADKNVLKSNGTEVDGADGVPLVFKMEQLKGVSLHNLLQSNL